MDTTPHLTRTVKGALAWLGDSHQSEVTLAFTERTGGCSRAPYASLNLNLECGDDAQDVAENRRRVLAALGCEGLEHRLVNPLQVHGSHVVLVDDASQEGVERARLEAREGADAIVCTVPDVPVLICCADCAAVVLTCRGAFAVAHSGWRGTEACIAPKALRLLCEKAGCTPADVTAYIGPHIGAADYEVDAELARRFADSFGTEVSPDGRHLDIGLAVRRSLVGAGMRPEAVCDECPSTASSTDRFYSYRAEGGTCGRHGALAVLRSHQEEVADDGC